MMSILVQVSQTKYTMSKRKLVTQKLSNDIFMVSLAVNQTPAYKLDVSKDIIKWGIKNDYPDYLLYLYLNDPVNNTIINSKARYVSGLSIKTVSESLEAAKWLKYANKFETIKQYRYKVILDRLISGMSYTLISPNIIGTPLEFIHLEFAKCRISECGNIIRYSEDWTQTFKYPIIDFPIWYEGIKEPSVYVEKRYTPCAKIYENYYGKPEWQGATLDIDTNIEINTFFNSLVKNNFSAGTIVTLFTGKIKPEEKADIKERLTREHSGTNTAGSTVLSFANEDAKGAEVTSLNSNDLDKQYQEVAKRCKDNIITGHNVPAVLFKQVTPGALGQRNELIEANELFINEYVKVEQERDLEFYQKFYKLRSGKVEEFEIEQVQAIGIDYTDPNISKYLTNDEMREKLGLPVLEAASQSSSAVSDALNTLSPLVATKVLETMTEDEIRGLASLPAKVAPTIIKTDASGNPIPATQVQQTDVNENLKNLSGRQFQGLMRIVKKYDDEKLTKEQASMLMTGSFGISNQEALEFLGVADEDEEEANTKMSEDKNSIFFSLVKKYAHAINHNDPVVNVEYVNNNVQLSATLNINEVRSTVLNELKGNPELTEKELSKLLEIELEKVEEAVTWLKKHRLIDQDLMPTKKGTNKKINKEKLTRTEVYTEYTYGLSDSATGNILIPTSRQFCRDMVELSKTSALTFESIDAITNEFGENAWDFRGGFYTKKGTNQTTPWCRHVWIGTTKTREIEE